MGINLLINLIFNLWYYFMKLLNLWNKKYFWLWRRCYGNFESNSGMWPVYRLNESKIRYKIWIHNYWNLFFNLQRWITICQLLYNYNNVIVLSFLSPSKKKVKKKYKKVCTKKCQIVLHRISKLSWRKKTVLLLYSPFLLPL